MQHKIHTNLYAPPQHNTAQRCTHIKELLSGAVHFKLSAHTTKYKKHNKNSIKFFIVCL